MGSWGSGFLTMGFLKEKQAWRRSCYKYVSFFPDRWKLCVCLEPWVWLSRAGSLWIPKSTTNQANADLLQSLS